MAFHGQHVGGWSTGHGVVDGGRGLVGFGTTPTTSHSIWPNAGQSQPRQTSHIASAVALDECSSVDIGLDSAGVGFSAAHSRSVVELVEQPRTHRCLALCPLDMEQLAPGWRCCICCSRVGVGIGDTQANQAGSFVCFVHSVGEFGLCHSRCSGRGGHFDAHDVATPTMARIHMVIRHHRHQYGLDLGLYGSLHFSGHAVD